MNEFMRNISHAAHGVRPVGEIVTISRYGIQIDWMMGILFVVFAASILVPLVFNQIATTDTSDFPAGTGTLWTTLLPLVVLFAVVMYVYKKSQGND